MPPKTQRKRINRKRKGKARKTKASNVSEYASLSVKSSLTTGGGFLPNQLYNVLDTNLTKFPRAVILATAYQYYRIKKVALTFIPKFDTYTAVNATAAGTSQVGKPNLYYMIDKSGSVPPNITLEGLKQMGARPRQLDEKNMVVSWSPSVLEGVLSGITGTPNLFPGKFRVSPWLTTNGDIYTPSSLKVSNVSHLGLYWYIDQFMTQATGDSPPPYTIEMEVQFEFKKPRVVITSSTMAIPAQTAVLNDSPDGIVGGNDGV